ncbi:30S ribosomal protein S13 [Candidatus Pacearchaeota archaeon]|nr:30S ribosomal protein S13 [Candidatus Pacearchaeota archaeon]
MEQKQTGKPEERKYGEKVVRILSEDIEGNAKLYVGLTKIKGVSWSLSNAICNMLKIDKNRKIGSLTDEEIKKIIEFLKNPQLPNFLFNRKFDLETGENKHLVGTNLELQKDFDIKRLKKIKSYRGIRHAAGLPVRGQRTKSHFRRNRSKSIGIKKKAKKSP